MAAVVKHLDKVIDNSCDDQAAIQDLSISVTQWVRTHSCGMDSDQAVALGGKILDGTLDRILDENPASCAMKLTGAKSELQKLAPKPLPVP